MNKFELINVAASLLVLGAGIVTHFFLRRRIFQVYPSLRLALEFWILRWWFLTLAWVLFDARIQQSTGRWIVLAVVDFDSILTQAFCWALLLGKNGFKEETSKRKLVYYLSLGYTFLLLWNFLLATTERHWFIGTLSGQWWTLISLLLATFNCLLIAYAFMVRYKWYSVMIVLISLAYAVMQIPAYAEAFSFSASRFPVYTSLLALLKILTGVAAYSMFLLLRPSYSPFKISAKLKTKLGVIIGSGMRKFTWASMTALLAAFVVDIFYHWLQGRLPGLLP